MPTYRVSPTSSVFYWIIYLTYIIYSKSVLVTFAGWFSGSNNISGKEKDRKCAGGYFNYLLKCDMGMKHIQERLSANTKWLFSACLHENHCYLEFPCDLGEKCVWFSRQMALSTQHSGVTLMTDSQLSYLKCGGSKLCALKILSGFSDLSLLHTVSMISDNTESQIIAASIIYIVAIRNFNNKLLQIWFLYHKMTTLLETGQRGIRCTHFRTRIRWVSPQSRAG